MTPTDTTPPRQASPGGERMITEKDLARRVGLSVRTLQRYRASGAGPAWSRLGPGRGVVRYEEAAVAAWVARTSAG